MLFWPFYVILTLKVHGQGHSDRMCNFTFVLKLYGGGGGCMGATVGPWTIVTCDIYS